MRYCHQAKGGAGGRASKAAFAALCFVLRGRIKARSWWAPRTDVFFRHDSPYTEEFLLIVPFYFSFFWFEIGKIWVFPNTTTFYHNLPQEIKSQNHEKIDKLSDVKMVKFTNLKRKTTGFDKVRQKATRCPFTIFRLTNWDVHSVYIGRGDLIFFL